MDKLKAPGKPFDISKRAVWEAWEKVKANKGAPGVDAVKVAEFESDLKNNLYKIWNRLSSGTYFPPPVRAVEIPKPHGGARESWACLLSGIGWRRRWWRGQSRRGPNRSSIPTPTATGRGAPRWTRSPFAGGGAGRPAG
jgi:hypothetical protein